MKARTIVSLTASHVAVALAGFAMGIYALPVVIEPQPPAAAVLGELERRAVYTGRFERDLPGSDWLHWGEGIVAVAPDSISLRGELAPGPDYKVYLSPEFVTDAEEFLAVKANAVRVGDVRSFHGFVVAIPTGVDVERYNSVVVWCEAFGMFISAAQYRF